MPPLQRYLVVAILFGAVSLAAQPASDPALVIRGATVLQLNGAPPLADGAVVIRGDRIVDVGPAASIEAPARARTVDARGKYLIPGLIEMHAHVSKTRASSLGLFIAHGVTTIRDMGGDHDELLRWRRDVNRGRRVGPRMLIAGPYLESAANIARMAKDPPAERVEPFDRIRIPIGTPDQAERVVNELAAKELDFLKIRTVADRDTYIALNRAAAAHGLKVVGHAPFSPEVMLQAGQDGIEHGISPSDGLGPGAKRLEIWRRFAAAGVPVVPTLVVYRAPLAPIARLSAIVDDAQGRVEPRRRYLSRYLILDWKEQLLETTVERQTMLRQLWEPLVEYAREMHEAGVELFAGSDVAVLNIYPGSSLHDELELLVQAVGMTPLEALERATRRPARFLGLDNSIGTIERGKVADLLLLDADPLVDIGNTRRIAAVVVRGELHDQKGISRILEAVAAAPDIKEDDWGRTSKRVRAGGRAPYFQ